MNKTGALTGELVRLRELRDDDLPDLISWWQDPDQAIFQTSGPVHPKPADTLAETFRTWSRNTETDLGLSVVAKDSGSFLGHVALYGASVRSRCATFAIVIGPAHQGKGFGTDAVRTVLRYAFTELGLHRVELTANGYNERALATYARCGFVEEGRHRESVYRDGSWHDLVLMGILAREWRAARP